MDTKKLTLILNLIKDAEDLKPFIETFLRMLSKYMQEIEEPLDELLDNFRRIQIRSVKFYEDSGLTRDEAIVLAIHNMNPVNEYQLESI
jgi:hypothetical protein